MSKHEPLLSDEEAKHLFIQTGGGGDMDGVLNVRDIYEGARVKDRELIQTLVDALDQTRDAFDLYASCRCDGSGCPVCRVMDRADNALFSANQHGFKPSDQ